MEITDTMTGTQIKERIHKYIVDTTFADVSIIKDDTLLFDEGIFDSMGLISLITFLEDEFTLKTEDTDLVVENFESISAITNFVSTRL